MFKQTLAATLMLTIWGAIEIQTAPARAGESTQAIEGKSPANMTPLPTDYLQKMYPNTQQDWSYLNKDGISFYRALIKDKEQKTIAEVSYCLVSYSDGLEWSNSVTRLEELARIPAKSSQKVSLQNVDMPVLKNLQSFLDSHKTDKEIILYKVSSSHFMSPQNSGPEGLKISELESYSGYCIQIGKLKFWLNSEGLWLEDGFHWHDSVS